MEHLTLPTVDLIFLTASHGLLGATCGFPGVHWLHIESHSSQMLPKIKLSVERIKTETSKAEEQVHRVSKMQRKQDRVRPSKIWVFFSA